MPVPSSSSNTTCRACSAPLPLAFLDLGCQPLANNLCAKNEHHDDRVELRLTRCAECALVQLDTIVDPALLFTDYLYQTGASATFRRHFDDFAESCAMIHGGSEERLVVDAGSNDGTLLGSFKKRGWRTVGVDPAANLAETARKNGADHVEVAFFTPAVAQRLAERFGKADLITANNVFAHTPDWHSFVQAAKGLLASGGFLSIEFPYVATMLRDGTFDLAYFEHASYPAVAPLVHFFHRYDLYVVDAEPIPVHGGSLRLQLSLNRELENSNGRVGRLLDEERTTTSAKVCAEFAKNAVLTARRFRDVVRAFRANGHRVVSHRVVGYGAPAKAVTLIEFAGLAAADIDYIVDDNPLKQGRMLPGSHIPIVPSSRLDVRAGDGIVILPWNLREEILKKLPRGSKAIVPMPKLEVIAL